MMATSNGYGKGQSKFLERERERKRNNCDMKDKSKDPKWKQLACVRCTMDELRKLREKSSKGFQSSGKEEEG